VTDAEIGLATTLLTAAGGSLAVVTRWAVGLWATIRREDIAATKESAALKREQDARLVERQIATIDRVAILVDEHTARDLAAQAEVKQAIVRVEAKVDSALDWRERFTPLEMQAVDPPERRDRIKTAPQGYPQGYRPPRPGGHDD
jgi:hypothetical protein